MSDRTALYRFYNDAGRLLYVGISLSPVERQRQHRAADWYSDIARQTIQWHETRAEALTVERAAIETEKPIHNRQYNKKRTAAAADAIRKRWWARRAERAVRQQAAEVAAKQQRAAQAKQAALLCHHDRVSADGKRICCSRCLSPAEMTLVQALLVLKDSRQEVRP